MRALYGICKIIFCRLMMLYTQYCPIGVFIYVSSLLFPYCCRCFHLQTPEKVLFVTITIATIVFYWTTVLQAQFLPINLLFLVSFVAESISLKVVLPCYRWYEIVPICFRWLQLVSCGSSLVQVVFVFCSFSSFCVVPSRFSLFLALVCTIWYSCQNIN